MYTVILLRAARRALAHLPTRDYERVVAAINALATNPRPAGCKKLTGSNEWRIRVGNYRVIYLIEDAKITVTVTTIGHRREVYR